MKHNRILIDRFVCFFLTRNFFILKFLVVLIFQIHIDVPRMNPHVPLFQQNIVQEMFERILFIWAIRHPASGYVQGINDLVTPFFIVFLQEALDSG